MRHVGHKYMRWLWGCCDLEAPHAGLVYANSRARAVLEILRLVH